MQLCSCTLNIQIKEATSGWLLRFSLVQCDRTDTLLETLLRQPSRNSRMTLWGPQRWMINRWGNGEIRYVHRTWLVVQWMGLYLPMQGKQVKTPGPGRYHMPQGNWAWAPQLLKPHALKSAHTRACTLQWDKPARQEARGLLVNWRNARAKGKESPAFSSVQFCRSVVSDSLQPHKAQPTRPPCPSPTPRVHPNPCPSSRWCHPTISSSAVPFSSCPQSFPALNFQMFKLVLEKAEKQEIKLSTSTGSSKKQESSRKTSISALLTMPKPLTVWITTNCGKFFKR